MININGNRSDCCGCGACFIVCPVNAIKMREDDRGFLHPYIFQEKCIKCDMCEKVCVFIKRKGDR